MYTTLLLLCHQPKTPKTTRVVTLVALQNQFSVYTYEGYADLYSYLLWRQHLCTKCRLSIAVVGTRQVSWFRSRGVSEQFRTTYAVTVMAYVRGESFVFISLKYQLLGKLYCLERCRSKFSRTLTLMKKPNCSCLPWITWVWKWVRFLFCLFLSWVFFSSLSRSPF